jgi:hypothetical protein
MKTTKPIKEKDVGSTTKTVLVIDQLADAIEEVDARAQLLTATDSASLFLLKSALLLAKKDIIAIIKLVKEKGLK